MTGRASSTGAAIAAAARRSAARCSVAACAAATTTRCSAACSTTAATRTAATATAAGGLHMARGREESDCRRAQKHAARHLIRHPVPPSSYPPVGADAGSSNASSEEKVGHAGGSRSLIDHVDDRRRAAFTRLSRRKICFTKP